MPATSMISSREIPSVRSTRPARSAWMFLASVGETSHACRFKAAFPGSATRSWWRERFTSSQLEPVAALHSRAGTGVRGASWRRLRTGGDRNLEESETEMRGRRLLGESEEPRRGGKKRPVGRVEGQVHRHRDDLEQAELVVGEQAVADRANAERYGKPSLHPNLPKIQQRGRGDEHASRQVIEHAVNSGRNEAHLTDLHLKSDRAAKAGGL